MPKLRDPEACIDDEPSKPTEMTCRKVAKNSCGTQPTNHDNGVLLLVCFVGRKE